MSNRRFLERFEPRQRSYIANLFLHQVRRGVTDPQRVYSGVRFDVSRQANRARLYGRILTVDRNGAILNALDEYRDEAIDYAKWAIEWDNLPDDEKQSIKRERSEVFIRERMAEQPPTDKQIKYLRSLGWQGEIESKLFASQKIDELLKAGEGKIQWV